MHSLPEITPPTFPTLNTITTPIIHLIFGPQGAGKTTYLRQLADWSACTRFSIDDWMSELFSPDITRPLSFPWVIERVARCEKRIWAVACDVARQGGNVALDLGFMKAASVPNLWRWRRLKACQFSGTTSLHRMSCVKAG